MNQLTIVDDVVDALPTLPRGQVIYRDATLRGFALRVGIERKTYFVERRVGDRIVRCNIGVHGAMLDGRLVNAGFARAKAEQLLATIRSGGDEKSFKRKVSDSDSLAGAIRRYFVHGAQADDAQKQSDRQCLETAFARWMDKPIASITRPTVRHRHMRLELERGSLFARRAMTLLREVFDFAIQEYGRRGGLTVNPVKRNLRQRAWKQPKGIAAGDLRGWFAAVTDLTGTDTLKAAVVSDYLIFLLLTGARRQEGAQLKWADIDFGRRMANVGRDLALPSFILNLLKARKRTAVSEYIFPSSGGRGYVVEPAPQIAWIIDRSGVRFTIEDLRRTFRAYLHRDPGSPQVVGRSGGLQWGAVERVASQILRDAGARQKG